MIPVVISNRLRRGVNFVGIGGVPNKPSDAVTMKATAMELAGTALGLMAPTAINI